MVMGAGQKSRITGHGKQVTNPMLTYRHATLRTSRIN
jgi:hypothetical protein